MNDTTLTEALRLLAASRCRSIGREFEGSIRMIAPQHGAAEPSERELVEAVRHITRDPAARWPSAAAVVAEAVRLRRVRTNARPADSPTNAPIREVTPDNLYYWGGWESAGRRNAFGVPIVVELIDMIRFWTWLRKTNRTDLFETEERHLARTIAEAPPDRRRQAFLAALAEREAENRRDVAFGAPPRPLPPGVASLGDAIGDLFGSAASGEPDGPTGLAP